jgi:hypothetical protein
MTILLSKHKAQTLRYYSCVFFGTIYCRTLQAENYHRVVLPRSAGRHTRYEYSPRYVSLFVAHSGSLSSLPAHALPRWPEERENYMPPEVVKIVVGNKLDKVKSSPLLSSPSSFPPTADARHARTHPNAPHLGILSTSAHIRGAAFAARTGCQFVEASAKTAEGVTEAFNEVVARIIDAPSLWNENKPKSSGRTAVSGLRRATAESMPGNIDLSQVQDEDTSGRCLC